jgi:6-pyruvoyltetrahydropterin/6-carboxytetrahydropterin synthase
MFEVEVISTFSAAHRLRDYNGKCEHLHGHNYRVHVTARSETTVAGGMVMDFGELKEAATTVLDGLDHAYLNDVQPFDEIEPSAENIAAHIFNELLRHLGDKAHLLYAVSVWESDTSRASFIRDA